MENELYPLPDVFLRVFNVAPIIDDDFMTYTYNFKSRSDLSVSFSFSVLDLSVRAAIKLGEKEVSSFYIEGAKSVAIDEKSQRIIAEFHDKGYKQELIISPGNYLAIEFVKLKN